MVDFKPNEKQETEFKAMFTKKELLGFNGNQSLISPMHLLTHPGFRLPLDIFFEEQQLVQ